MISRLLENIVFEKKYGRQMRFIAGPRQTGKTTLAKSFLKKQGSQDFYYNWDKRSVRNRYRESPYFFMEDVKSKSKNKQWICLDEIHKMPKWKNILKDFFDSYEDHFQFLITGSARLDFFRKSGDSLAGRYFLFHLFPLTLREVCQNKLKLEPPPREATLFIENQLGKTKNKSSELAIESLLKLSGFPEPYLNGTEEFHRLWQEDYIDRLVREDLRDLTRIQDLENVATLLPFLADGVGSSLSLNALREDLEVSHTAMRTYIKALRLCYIVFLLTPYSKRIRSAVKKEPKLYFYDWTRVKDPAARFENFVACELQTWMHGINDAGFAKMELKYIRTKTGQETDFLLTQDQKPWLLLEVKTNSEKIASHHTHRAKQLGDIPFVQIVKETSVCRVLDKKTYVISADQFFS